MLYDTISMRLAGCSNLQYRQQLDMIGLEAVGVPMGQHPVAVVNSPKLCAPRMVL